MPSHTVTLKLRNPNPLFVKWTREWLEYAKEHNLRTINVFENALDSLNKYPLPLDQPKDCIILEGFGPKLCNMLEEKLKRHKTRLLTENLNNSATKNVNNKKKNSRKKTALPIENEPLKKSNTTVSPSKKDLLQGTSTALIKNTIASLSISPKKTKKDSKLIAEEDEGGVFFSPNSFDVILLVDVQETSGKNKRIMDATITGLQKQKIKFDVRRLNVGDFAWICRNKDGAEVVLPYIVERKRMDDFGSSIKDGRFHEQKFRLQQSGVQNLIYLIESYGNNQYTGLPIQTLLQAATNTQVQDNFSVKFTDCHDDSILYLSVMTELLEKKYKNKVLISCSKMSISSVKATDNFIPVMKFEEFNKLSSKTRNYKTREIFVKQLLQLKLLSVDKALAITNIFSTPKSLITAYKNCINVNDGEKLLADIRFGPIKRPIGPIISKTIYQFYMNSQT